MAALVDYVAMVVVSARCAGSWTGTTWAGMYHVDMEHTFPVCNCSVCLACTCSGLDTCGRLGNQCCKCLHQYVPYVEEVFGAIMLC